MNDANQPAEAEADRAVLDAAGRLQIDLRCTSCGSDLYGQRPESPCPKCSWPIYQSLPRSTADPDRPHRPPPVTIDEDDRVGGDIQCVRCKYNLRGISRTGNCPECGMAVQDTFNLQPLTRPVRRHDGTLNRTIYLDVDGRVADRAYSPCCICASDMYGLLISDRCPMCGTPVEHSFKSLRDLSDNRWLTRVCLTIIFLFLGMMARFNVLLNADAMQPLIPAPGSPIFRAAIWWVVSLTLTIGVWMLTEAISSALHQKSNRQVVWPTRIAAVVEWLSLGGIVLFAQREQEVMHLAPILVWTTAHIAMLCGVVILCGNLFARMQLRNSEFVLILGGAVYSLSPVFIYLANEDRPYASGGWLALAFLAGGGGGILVVVMLAIITAFLSPQDEPGPPTEEVE